MNDAIQNTLLIYCAIMITRVYINTFKNDKDNE